MALDSRIPLSAVGITLQSPLEIQHQVLQTQDLQAQVQARRAAADTARQEAADQAAIRRVLTETNGDVEAALPKLRTIAPKAALQMETELKKQRVEELTAMKTQTELSTRQLGHALQLGQSVVDDPSYQAVKPLLVGAYPDLKTMLPATYDPQQWQRLMQMGLSTKEFADKQQEGLTLIKDGKLMEGLSALGSATRNQQDWDKFLDLQKHFGVPPPIIDQFGPTWSPDAVAHAAQLGISSAKREELAGQAETRAGQAESRAATAAHQTVLEQQGADRLAIARQRLAQGGAKSTDQEDVDAIADGIISGDQPPTLTGMYRYAAPVRAALAKKGYPLAAAQTDWTAAQKHFATLNGAQQTRLQQAVDTAAHSLDVIDTLAGQWKGGRFPVLNRANLALAKNGAYGADVATTARQLDAQIADVTAELANAYMGGNSPSDHALQLAASNLSSDWSESTLKSMTALARTNLKIRQNAIRNVGAVGVSGANPYAPPPGAPPTTKTDPLGIR